MVHQNSILTSPRRMTRLREDEESKEDDDKDDEDHSGMLEMDWMLGSEPKSRDSASGRRYSQSERRMTNYFRDEGR